jgi:hypothetical protein
MSLDRYTTFAGHERIAQGSLADAARAAHETNSSPVLVLDDSTGRQVELDIRGSLEDALSRLPHSPPEPPRPRGRPKLGVTAREVTLLPRHWEWLSAQSGGASAALRRLVDQARKDSGGADAARQALDVVYRVTTMLAGDLPGYEEAIRALFARDRERFAQLVAIWPTDIAAYVGELAARIDAPLSN